jgi:hypothetical protein
MRESISAAASGVEQTLPSCHVTSSDARRFSIALEGAAAAAACVQLGGFVRESENNQL